MAIESRNSIGPIQKVLPKHDVESVRPDDRAKQEGRKEQEKHQDKGAEPHPVSNFQGELTGKLIDVTA